MILREPSPDIIQWDTGGCETACTAQLLYMYGMLESAAAPSLDGHIGRRRDCVDIAGGNVRLLLEKGFVIRDISPFDHMRAIGPQGSEYVRNVWREKGYTETEVATQLPLIYPSLRKRILAMLELERASEGRYVITTKEPTFDEFLHYLSQGPAGLCLPEACGYGHSVLVVRQTHPVLFEIYDPNKGMTGSTILRMRRWVKRGFQSYQLA